jgi:hypothetical membrane protein
MRTALPIRALALAGIAGPVVFIVLVVIQGLMQPDYSHVAMPISALAAWPAGWLQNLNFFLLAALLAVFTVGVNAAIRPARFGFLGIALLFANALGIFLSGLFPWMDVNGVPTETRPHVLAAVLTFASASIGLVALSRRMKTDPLWRDLWSYVLATGLVMLVLFVTVGGFAVAEGAPLHRWTGLLQRLLVLVWFACLVVIARRMLQLSREPALSP